MASYRALLVIKDILQRKWDETQQEKSKFYGTGDLVDQLEEKKTEEEIQAAADAKKKVEESMNKSQITINSEY